MAAPRLAAVRPSGAAAAAPAPPALPPLCRAAAPPRRHQHVASAAVWIDLSHKSAATRIQAAAAARSGAPQKEEATTPADLPPPRDKLAVWRATTQRLMHLATLALLADAAVRAAAQAAAGSTLQGSAAWVPLASNLTSFLILSSTFIVDGEQGAIACYMAGLLCTGALLAQAFAFGAVPAAVFWPAAVMVAGATAVNCAKLAGMLERPGGRAGAWRLWRRIGGCVGWAMVPQIAYLSLVLSPAAADAGASWGPAAVSLGAGAALLGLLRSGRLPASWRGAWDVPSWTATLLFMLEPIAALASAAAEPSTLLPVAPANFLLPALATGLQVPRALLAGDHMWFTGTSWAAVFACVQAAVAAAARGEPCVAAVALGAPLLWAAWFMRQTADVKGCPTPLAALQPVAEGYWRERQPWKQMASLQRRWALLAAARRQRGGTLLLFGTRQTD